MRRPARLLVQPGEGAHQRSGSSASSSAASMGSQAPRCRDRATTAEAVKPSGGREGKKRSETTPLRISPMRLLFAVVGWVATTTRLRAPSLPTGPSGPPRVPRRVIQHRVVLAPHHHRETGQIGEHRPSSGASIEPKQGTGWRQAMHRERATDDGKSLLAFFAVLPLARVAKTAEPRRGRGLRHDRTGPDDFSPCASGGASRTDRIEAALGRSKGLPFRQRTWASRFTCAIAVEDLPRSAGSIQPFASLSLCGERAGEHRCQKERTQRFTSFWGQAGQKAAERRAARQLLPVEPGQEGLCPGCQPFREGFPRGFTTAGVPAEESEEVDDVVLPEAPARKAHALTDRRKHPLLAKRFDQESHVATPGGRRGNRRCRGVDEHRRSSETGPLCLLREERVVSFPWRHLFCPLATHEASRCVIRGIRFLAFALGRPPKWPGTTFVAGSMLSEAVLPWPLLISSIFHSHQAYEK